MTFQTITLDQLTAIAGGTTALKPYTIARDCRTGRELPGDYGQVGSREVRVLDGRHRKGLAFVGVYHPMQDTPIRYDCVRSSDIEDVR